MMRLGRNQIAVSLLVLCAAVPAFSQITAERVRNAIEEPQNWLTYSGNYASWRYSPLDQINAANVRRLQTEWVYQIAEKGVFETSPLVVDGILYGTGPDDTAFALDARTGKAIWRYQRALPSNLPTCCGRVNRGMAILGTNLYMATLDAHLLALDTRTGNVIWDVEAADYHQGYTFTVAPLAVKDKIVVGVSGGEFAVRGFIDAYDANTGKRAWRHDTVPVPGEPGVETWAGTSWKTGGAPAWITGSYDPELNLIYWPTGNPGPDMYGGARRGDNLYSDCMLALDADTGKLKWYFQFTPHDVYDYDATQIPILIEADWKGPPRKLLVQVNRNGFFYVLDRMTGEFLLAKPFVNVTWARGIGPDGRPVVVRLDHPLSGTDYVCPGTPGGTNWYSPSYNPQTGLVYVETREQCDLYTAAPPPFAEGQRFIGSAGNPFRGERGWGAVKAFDPHTGQTAWEYKLYSPPWSGTLSTAGGLVFAGDIDGNLTALNARTGKDLWHFQVGAAITASAISYAIDGKQYVAIAAGSGLFAFGLPEEETAQH
jgi:alcohol dehydrogenase (cytochrome c)